LIMHCFLGLRLEKDALVIDPVVPPDLNGLSAEAELAGRKFRVTYHVDRKGCGPTRIQSKGQDIPFTREANPYRTGGVKVLLANFAEGRPTPAHELIVWLE
jgi:1,2-beta-oligoglucan phosphorylase